MGEGQKSKRPRSHRRPVSTDKVSGFLGGLVDLAFDHFGAGVDPRLRSLIEDLARDAGRKVALATKAGVADVEPYQVLGIPASARWELIQDRYRTLARLTHPDRSGDAKLFDLVTKAYRELERRHEEGAL